jgi:hypothetical protein
MFLYIRKQITHAFAWATCELPWPFCKHALTLQCKLGFTFDNLPE